MHCLVNNHRSIIILSSLMICKIKIMLLSLWSLKVISYIHNIEYYLGIVIVHYHCITLWNPSNKRSLAHTHQRCPHAKKIRHIPCDVPGTSTVTLCFLSSRLFIVYVLSCFSSMVLIGRGTIASNSFDTSVR